MNYIKNNEMKTYFIGISREPEENVHRTGGLHHTREIAQSRRRVLCFSKCFKRSYIESMDLWKVMNLRDQLEVKVRKKMETK